MIIIYFLEKKKNIKFRKELENEKVFCQSYHNLAREFCNRLGGKQP
jgi:hypothetical protein